MSALLTALVIQLCINAMAICAGYICGRVHAEKTLKREIELRAAFQRVDELLDARGRRAEGSNIIELFGDHAA